MGLLSLDMNGLRIVIGSGNEAQAKLARAIAPVRENGNLLLCTLLFGNVAVNALLSILMADISGGLYGFLISTFAIVIFGEIIPQSTCSRYPLEIGTASLPIVKLMIVLFYIITKPMAWMLDKVLGQELGTIYSTQELVTMLKLHEEGDVVDKAQTNALIGALQYKDMLVSEVMTPISEAYMMSYDTTLSFKTLREIFQTGFSRIPGESPLLPSVSICCLQLTLLSLSISLPVSISLEYVYTETISSLTPLFFFAYSYRLFCNNNIYSVWTRGTRRDYRIVVCERFDFRRS